MRLLLLYYPRFVMRSRHHIGTQLFFICSCIVLSVIITPAAQNRSVLSDADLIAKSDVIVTGRVATIAAGIDDRTIYTYVTVDIATVLKGWVPERKIVIKQLGGRIGDLEQVVVNRATFERGEEVLLFLEAGRRDFTLSTTALWQGKWTITRDRVSGDAIARRPLVAAVDRGVFGPAADARVLSTLAAAIRRQTNDASDRPSNKYIDVSPRDARKAAPVAGAAPAAVESFLRNAAASTPPIPGPPINLTLHFSQYVLVLSWTAPTTGDTPTDYIIEAGSAPGLSDIAIFSVGPVTTFTQETVYTGVPPAYARVRAVNRFGAGPASNEVFYPATGPGPLPPSSLTPTVNGSTVTLTWTAPTNFALDIDYRIEVGSAPRLSDLARFSAGTNVTTFTATNVGPGVYYVRVRAYGFLRLSAPSNEVIVTVGGPAPCFSAPMPPGSFGGAVSGSTVSLTWTASSGPVNSYIVEAGQTIGVWNTRLDTATSATGLTVTNVPNGAYFVRVRGRNTCGVGAPSNEAVVTVP
jgi:hypothetical protein